MLGGKLFVVSLFVNTLFPLVFAAYLVIASAASIFLHLNFEKQYPYFCFTFVTVVDVFQWLFSGVQTLNTYTVPWLFVEKAE